MSNYKHVKNSTEIEKLKETEDTMNNVNFRTEKYSILDKNTQ